jgi:hypothetical protein
VNGPGISAGPAVWVLFDEHDQDAAIAAALGLRRAANDHRCRGQHRDAVELDRLADDLERIIKDVQAAYREAHPPGEQATARTGTNDASRPASAKRSCGDATGTSPRIVSKGCAS